MSQPPAGEPPQDRPEQDNQMGWQAPGPAPTRPLQGGYLPYPPPYGAPPGPQNPYGGDTTSFYQPIESGGMSTTVKAVLGVVIGLGAGVFIWFTAFILIASNGSEDNVLLLGSLAPLLVPAPLLLWKATRPWAVGLLAGTAIVSIGLSGLCASLISPGSSL